MSKEINVDLESIPEALKSRDTWLCWKYQEKDGRQTKIPCAPYKGEKHAISANDPNNLTSFDNASYHAEGNPDYGLGFVFFGGDGFVGIDIDHCVDDWEQLNKTAEKVLDHVESYTEYSPSGEGLHIIAEGKLSSNFKNPEKGLEMYYKDRFFTVTGDHLEGTNREVQYSENLRELRNLFREKPVNRVTSRSGDSVSFPNKCGMGLKQIRVKDSKLDRLLNGDETGYTSTSEFEMALMSKLYYWGYRENQIYNILKSFVYREKQERQGYLETTYDNCDKDEQIDCKEVKKKDFTVKNENDGEEEEGKVSYPTRIVKNPPKNITEELKIEAERILKSSDEPLEEIKEHLDEMIAGEEDNKKLLFLLLLSGLIDDPAKKQIILLKGDPGGGKTHISNELTGLFEWRWDPEELEPEVLAELNTDKKYGVKKVGRFSKTAIDYTRLKEPLLKTYEDGDGEVEEELVEVPVYDVMYIQEIGWMDQEDQGVATIKFLGMDDEGYTVEITKKTRDGGFETIEKHIPPITVLSCTVRSNMEGQFDRRAWSLVVDESKEQTLRVKKFKIRKDEDLDDKKFGFIELTPREEARAVLTQVVRTLEPVEVFIPFKRRLYDLLPSNLLAVRGHYDKVKTLVHFYAFLCQKQGDISTGAFNGRETVCASPKKTAMMLPIAEAALRKMASGYDVKLENFLRALKKHEIRLVGDLIDLDLKKEIKEKSNYSMNTINQYLNTLTERGILNKNKSGRSTEFELEINIGEVLKDAGFIEGKLEHPEALGVKMCDESLKYIEKYYDKAAERELQGKKDLFSQFRERIKNERRELTDYCREHGVDVYEEGEAAPKAETKVIQDEVIEVLSEDWKDNLSTGEVLDRIEDYIYEKNEERDEAIPQWMIQRHFNLKGKQTRNLLSLLKREQRIYSPGLNTWSLVRQEEHV